MNQVQLENVMADLYSVIISKKRVIKEHDHALGWNDETRMFKIHKMNRDGKPFSYIFKWYAFSYALIIAIVAYLENWF